MSTFDLATVWQLTLEHPLFSAGLTLIAFQLALALYRRSGWLVLQPVMIGMLLVVSVLYLSGLDYQTYREGASMIAILVGPATVALAIPLYRHLRRIRQLFWPIMITLCVIMIGQNSCRMRRRWRYSGIARATVAGPTRMAIIEAPSR